MAATIPFETAALAAGVGHGGGAGHVAVGGRPGFYGGGFRGAYGPRYGYGYYGYPYGYGYGLGFGLGVGVGYGVGYPYYPYGYGYPAYGYPAYGAPGYAPGPYVYPPAGNGSPPANGAPAETGGMVGTPPGKLTDADVVLSVRTPAEAEVWINGVKTNQAGPRREFISSGLDPRRTYTFEIRAHWNGVDGHPVELVRRVPVQAGERRAIDFTIPLQGPTEVAPVSATSNSK